MVGMYSDLQYTSMNITINKHTLSLFIVTSVAVCLVYVAMVTMPHPLGTINAHFEPVMQLL